MPIKIIHLGITSVYIETFCATKNPTKQLVCISHTGEVHKPQRSTSRPCRRAPIDSTETGAPHRIRREEAKHLALHEGHQAQTQPVSCPV